MGIDPAECPSGYFIDAAADHRLGRPVLIDEPGTRSISREKSRISAVKCFTAEDERPQSVRGLFGGNGFASTTRDGRA